MIKFQALMQAIHQSIQGAAKLVEEQGIKHVGRFFDRVEDPDHNASSSPDKAGKKYIYRPKTYAMEFPNRTADGIETVTVEVPLITLTPITTPRISEVKFITELEVTSNEDNEVLVSFPKAGKPGFFGKSDAGPHTSNTRVEITIKSGETPEGLQKLIEGYERALRAQIPG